MSNLGNGKGILKFTNFILIQRINFSFYRNFIINLHIAYELNTSQRNSNTNFTLKNCIFGTVKLTRNADKSKFTYNGWGIALDRKGFWSFDNETARNVTILGWYFFLSLFLIASAIGRLNYWWMFVLVYPMHLMLSLKALRCLQVALRSCWTSFSSFLKLHNQVDSDHKN